MTSRQRYSTLFLLFFAFAVLLSLSVLTARADRRPSALESSNRGSHLSATDYDEVKILRASDSQVNDEYGWSVALLTDTLAVGSYLEDGGSGDPQIDAGVIYIYDRDLGGAENWGEVKKVRPSDLAAGDGFGSSVVLEGDTMVATSHLENGEQGAVYVFERNQGGMDNWGEITKITASDGQASDHFGFEISLSGDILVVGAPDEAGGGGDPLAGAGAAYVFYRDQGGTDNWGEVAKLTASDAAATDFFGVAVTIDGTTVVVGAFGEEGGSGGPGDYTGSAYIYEKDLGGADSWGERDILYASDLQAGDQFGIAMAIDGDTLIIGALTEEGGSGDPLTLAGAAYIYERHLGGTDNWGERVKIASSDLQSDDQFGGSVLISGDLILVSADTEDGGSGDPAADGGSVYLFHRDQGGINNWGEVTIFNNSEIQAGDRFGFGLALHNESIAIGAWREDGGAGDPIDRAGTAYILGTPPINDDFLDAIEITTDVFTDTQQVTYATTEGLDPVLPCAGNQKVQSVWYKFTPAVTGTLTITTTTSNFEVAAAVWTGTQGSLSNHGCLYVNPLSVSLNGGTEYFVELVGWDAPGLSRTLNFEAVFVPADPPPPGTSYVYLPLLRNFFPACFFQTSEQEPNDSSVAPNGPLCRPTTIKGAPNDENDYFSFETTEFGQITISLIDHPLESDEGAQLFLYFENTSNQVAFDNDPPYTINSSESPGLYIARVFTDQSKCTGNKCNLDYRLTVDFP
jgi:hypothetical protein